MIEVTITVKYNGIDTRSDGAFGNGFADFDCHFALCATLFEALLVRRGSGQCHTFYIVNHLGVDFLVASKHRQAGHLSGTADFMTDAEFDFCSSYIFLCCHIFVSFGFRIILILLFI